VRVSKGYAWQLAKRHNQQCGAWVRSNQRCAS